MINRNVQARMAAPTCSSTLFSAAAKKIKHLASEVNNLKVGFALQTVHTMDGSFALPLSAIESKRHMNSKVSAESEEATK